MHFVLVILLYFDMKKTNTNVIPNRTILVTLFLAFMDFKNI